MSNEYPARRVTVADCIGNVDLDQFPAGEALAIAGDGEAAIHDNTLAAGRALAVLLDYTDRHGEWTAPVADVMQDLLRDLLHLADAIGADFHGYLLAGAQHRYGQELRTEV